MSVHFYVFTDPCRKLPNGRRYSDAQTCYGYYKCLNGKSVTGICPNGFAFNAVKQGCIPDLTCSQPTGLLHRKYTTQQENMSVKCIPLMIFQFYIEKLGCAGVYLFFLFLIQNKCLSKNIKNIILFLVKLSNFTAEKISIYYMGMFS